MKKTKADYLYEFARTGEARNCSDAEEVERRFKAWVRRNNINIQAHGRNYLDNKLESGVDYTKSIIRKDPNLMRAFGLDYNNNRGANRGNGPAPRSNNRSYGSSRGYSNNSHEEEEGYSFGGMLRHYTNQAKSRSNGGAGFGAFFSGGVGKVILAIFAVVLLYKLVGDTVWEFLTSGAIFKVICMAIGALVSYAIFRAKNMGWPFGVKLVVVIVIWVVLFNYDF